MPYSVEYDPQFDIINIKAEGPVTVTMVLDMANDAARIAKEQGCFRILSDFREASIQLSMLETFNLPKMLAEVMSTSGLPVQKFRRALLPPAQWPLSLFFETVSKNRVQNVTLFRDIETARQWLLEKQSGI